MDRLVAGFFAASFQLIKLRSAVLSVIVVRLQAGLDVAGLSLALFSLCRAGDGRAGAGHKALSGAVCWSGEGLKSKDKNL